MFSARNVPAVVTEFPVASAEFEGEHPSVNDEAKSLIVQSLNVTEDHDRQEEDVKDPDENSGAGLANEPNSIEEYEIEDVVDDSDGSDGAPEGKCYDRHDT